MGNYAYFLGKALAEQVASHHHYAAFDGLRFRDLVSFVESVPRQNRLRSELTQRLWNYSSAVPKMRSAYRGVKDYSFRLGKHRCDLVHAISYAPPSPAARPWLPLVHDLSHMRLPHFHPAERVRWLEAHDRDIREAPLVNTVSEFTKNEIVELLGVAPDRIRVTHPGINPLFLDIAPRRDEAMARYQLSEGRYLLGVSTIEPRKNLPTLVEAFSKLKQEAPGDDAVLVLVGQAGWGSVRFPKDIERLRASGAIRFLGYVPTDDLRSLYQSTALFLYPSRYEGFGMPVAEAHASGAPAAISLNSGATEAGGGLAIEVEADDVSGWANVMRSALESRAWRDAKSRCSRVAAARAFSWGENARLTNRIYDEFATAVA